MMLCDVVDAWKVSNRSRFFAFVQQNGHVHLIGASPEGLCAFYAVGIAASMLGNIGWQDLSLAREFIDECTARGKSVSSAGVTYGELRCFLKFANVRSTMQISMRDLDTNVYGGVSSKIAVAHLRTLLLEDGVYLCAGYNSLS